MRRADLTSIHDDPLINWIHDQFVWQKKVYLADRSGINLVRLARTLRTYINGIRNRRGGIKSGYKNQAANMIKFVQGELISRQWDQHTNVILQAIQYGTKHIGQIAIEGIAFRRPVSARDKRELAKLTRSAHLRSFESVEPELPQSVTYNDNLGALGLQPLEGSEPDGHTVNRDNRSSDHAPDADGL